MEQSTRLRRPSSLAESAGPPPKRRKLRKGTQSCWDCKRRKARCTFSADTPETCDSCKRRGVDCVSQEVTDQPPPPGSNKHIVDRLGHVEALVTQLLKAARQDGHLGPSPESLAAEIHQWSNRNGSDSEESPVEHSGLETSTPPSQPVSQSISQEATYNRVPHQPATNPAEEFTEDGEPVLHGALSQRLLAAWPCKNDMDVLLGMPVETSQVIRAVTCARADSNDPGLPSLKILLQLPPKGSHPALVARKLLVLATFLQGIPESSSHQLDSLSTPYQTTMFRAVTTAHDLVTSNDDLVASLEGIECILLEALFKNYTGDLRQSWLAARRAVTIAQMLGLDRGIAPLSLSGFSVDPDDMWFRIVQFDRYIALMLGLPQSSVQDTFATPEALEKCSPLERMLRLCCVACGRILQRSAPELHDASLTQEVDKLLQDASAEMPPQFWVSPNLISCSSQSDKVREILRFNNHFMYYNILLQLHLPHFLTSKTQQESYHNKLVAITASREILSRYVSFRASQTTPYYCRGIDLVTFIPCTALSLAYLGDRNHCPVAPDTLPFTAHQRLSDRGLLEQTLAIMQGVVDVNGDAIAKRVATLLRYLLAIDEDAMSGGRYSVVFSPEIRKRGEDFGSHAALTHSNTVLEICLPHLPTIKIQNETPNTPIPQKLGPDRENTGDCHHNNRGNECSCGRRSARDWGDPSVVQVMPVAVDGPPDVLDRVDNAESGSPRNNSAEVDWNFENLDFAFLDSFIEGALEINTSHNS
ncbi:hypothetical protein CcaCcLH18_06928 [Colletotrichum camelliae]|nr:hypothetical protein CcaCcLH18_06928 [Colletotrichum camelliae]